MKQTKLTSEILCPIDSFLAQLAEHETEDPEVVGKFILFSVTLDLSDREKPDRVCQDDFFNVVIIADMKRLLSTTLPRDISLEEIN